MKNVELLYNQLIQYPTFPHLQSGSLAFTVAHISFDNDTLSVKLSGVSQKGQAVVIPAEWDCLYFVNPSFDSSNPWYAMNMIMDEVRRWVITS